MSEQQFARAISTLNRVDHAIMLETLEVCLRGMLEGALHVDAVDRHRVSWDGKAHQPTPLHGVGREEEQLIRRKNSFDVRLHEYALLQHRP